MDHASPARPGYRLPMLLGLAVSLAAHVVLFAVVGFRVPVGSTDEDVVRLATSEPAAPVPVDERPTVEETRVVRLSAAAAAGAMPTPVSPAVFDGSALPVAVSAAGDLSAAHSPLTVVHPARSTDRIEVAAAPAAFSVRAAPASTTGDAPPLYARGEVGDAKERWAEAAGMGARGIALRVGFGGGGACGIPGRGPVTSWFDADRHTSRNPFTP